MFGRIVTFGEITQRLKPPGFERFMQSPLLEATFGGGEANVAASLAIFGMDVAFTTVLPKNAIGDACIKLYPWIRCQHEPNPAGRKPDWYLLP